MYRIGSTLGVVSTCGRANTPKGARYLGRRPAFPQWCENPIQGRRIAVGDAAFSCDPLAGQGIRFALASAFAAASVIQYWKENSNRGAANRFYRDFVGQARVRHLEFLAKLELDLPADVLEPLPKRVSFSGRIGSAEFRNTQFSYALGDDGVEKFVSTPELYSEDSIGSDPLPPGRRPAAPKDSVEAH